MDTSIFGLSSLLDELRDTEKGLKSISCYEEHFGPIQEEKEQENVFYKERLAAFNTQILSLYGTVRFPACMEDEPFRIKDLLLRLVFASPSSTFTLTMDKKEIVITINIVHTLEDGTTKEAKKKLDELGFLQILSLMTIYLEEQLNLAVIEKVDNEDLPQKRESIIEQYNNNLQVIASQSGKDTERGGFQDVAGMDELKENLQKRIIWVLKNQEKAKRYRLTPPNGMLLYGPPGCGKTYFAQKFAEESGYYYLSVNGSDVASPFIHGTQGKIAEVFKTAEENAPTVICFDEFDSFVPSRGSASASHREEEVNEFLCQLNNCSQRGIFVIGTTNRMDMIDPAILRKGRLDIRVQIPAPEKETRKKMFALHLNGRPHVDDIDFDHLAELTDGYASSDIAYIVNEAALEAAHDDQPISSSYLEEAIKFNPSSLTSIRYTGKKVGFDV